MAGEQLRAVQTAQSWQLIKRELRVRAAADCTQVAARSSVSADTTRAPCTGDRRASTPLVIRTAPTQPLGPIRGSDCGTAGAEDRGPTGFR
jgi:hypothetical protein